MSLNVRDKCILEISDQQNRFSFLASCLAVPEITSITHNLSINAQTLPIPSQLKLADSKFLQKIRLGWIIARTVSNLDTRFLNCNLVKTSNLKRLMHKFWELEEYPDRRALSNEEKLCEIMLLKLFNVLIMVELSCL